MAERTPLVHFGRLTLGQIKVATLGMNFYMRKQQITTMF
jgi:hypothetical protein